MDEQDTLSALGVLGEWIWGNDLETIVYAQAFGHGKTLIFRFAQDNNQRPQSLTARIVTCYHGQTVDSPSATFPDRASMRTALWSAIATVWTECSEQPAIEDPDVILDVHDIGSTDFPSSITWSICHDDLFYDYVDLLLPPNQLSIKQPIDTVEFKGLIRLHQLGGRGCSIPVNTASEPRSQFAFKGIDSRIFLSNYESGTRSGRSEDLLPSNGAGNEHAISSQHYAPGADFGHHLQTWRRQAGCVWQSLSLPRQWNPCQSHREEQRIRGANTTVAQSLMVLSDGCSRCAYPFRRAHLPHGH